MTTFPIPLPRDHALRPMVTQHLASMHDERAKLEHAIALDEKLIAQHIASLEESKGALAYVLKQIAVCDEALGGAS